MLNSYISVMVALSANYCGVKNMMNLLRANQLSLADLLPQSVMVTLLHGGRKVIYSDRQLIQQRGDSTDTFSIVESGQVIAGNNGADGSFLTTALFNPGDFFGEFTLLAGFPRTQSLWAIGETVITHVSSGHFRKVFDSEPDFPRALLNISLRRMHFLVEFLDGQRRWPLPVRIAHLLLTSVEDLEGPTTQEINCRQDDLAYMLGVSRVAVGKALKTLESDRLVTLKYGSILLPDVRRLFDWLERHRQVPAITPPRARPS